MPLLSSAWRLFDVDDVEALLVTAVSRCRFASDLGRDERDDLVAYLFGVSWQLADQYDAKRASFSTLLFATAQLRAIDWYRKERGRTVWRFSGYVHERPRPAFVSLDAPDGDRLGETVAALSGDSTAGGLEDDRRLFGDRDRTRAADDALLGLGPRRRAA